MSASYYLQVIVTLGLFLGFLFLAIYFTRRFQAKNFSQDIKILDRRAIDAGASLLIVEVKKKKYLLSVGSKNTQLIRELE